jgi:oxaloacetate decarboxylase gamma subunit
MEPNLETAFMLMIIGMLTVFTILFLVVLCSKLMILIINRYFPELIELEQPLPVPVSHTEERKKISAIIAAVESVTAGKGSVREIKKINMK